MSQTGNGEERRYITLAADAGLEFVTLDPDLEGRDPVDHVAARLLHAEFARRMRLIPIAADAGSITVASSEANGRATFSAISVLTGREVVRLIAPATQISRAQERVFGPPPTLRSQRYMPEAVDEDVLQQAEETGLEFEPDVDADVDPTSAALLGERLSRQLRVLVLSANDGSIRLATSRPLAPLTLEIVAAITGLHPEQVIAPAERISAGIERAFARSTLLPGQMEPWPLEADAPLAETGSVAQEARIAPPAFRERSRSATLWLALSCVAVPGLLVLFAVLALRGPTALATVELVLAAGAVLVVLMISAQLGLIASLAAAAAAFGLEAAISTGRPEWEQIALPVLLLGALSSAWYLRRTLAFVALVAQRRIVAAPRREDAEPEVDLERFQPQRGLRFLLIANLVTATLYVGWWLTPGHVGVPVLFLLLGAAEAFNLVHNLAFWWAAWATKLRPPPRASTAFSIDVLITTYGEPLKVLSPTIEAAVALDLPHTTFVLDDAGRPEVESLARRLGAEYIVRSERTGAKAGNINHALLETSGDLIAVFDADHVPRRDFLRRLVGYFEDPKMAFVQTPQYYDNCGTNDVAQGAYEQQALFYGPICRGKSALTSAFCCGTNVILRRRALEEVGGFDENSVVEDFVTSMHLHRRGWNSVYFPYVLAKGVGPHDLRTYFRQQYRWARGSTGAFFSFEPFRHGFNLRQRLQYFVATTFYLNGLITPIYVLLPILYLFGGWSAFAVGTGSFVLFYAPYLALGLSTLRWGLGGELRLGHLRFTFGTFPVYGLASLAALFRASSEFQVTSKAESSRPRPPALAWITVLAFAATVCAIVAGVFLQPLSARTFTNISWAMVNLMLLSGITRLTVREGVAASDFASGLVARLPGRAGTQGLASPEPRPPNVAKPLPGAPEASTNGSDPAGGASLVLPELALTAAAPRPPRRDPPQLRRPAVVVAVLTFLGLLLRVALIDVQSLRLDEFLSLEQALMRPEELWNFLATIEVHVPGYPALLHYWVNVAGTSEWALRVPSVVFGTAAIPMLYLVGRRLVGSRAGLVATAIGAGSPFWVWHADEARMYPQLLFLMLASIYALMEAAHKGRAWRWIGYIVLLAASLYTHYFAFLMFPLHAAYLLTYRIRFRRLAAWVVCSAAALVLFSPWAHTIYTVRIAPEPASFATPAQTPPEASGPSAGSEQPEEPEPPETSDTSDSTGASDVASGLSSFASGFERVDFREEVSSIGFFYTFLFFVVVFLAGYNQALAHGGSAFSSLFTRIVVGSWPIVTVRAVLSRSLSWLGSRTALFLFLWVMLTFGVVFLLNASKHGVLAPRYLIITTPALFLAVAVPLSRLIRGRIIGVGVVFALMAGATLTDSLSATNFHREDFRTASSIIERDVRAGDLVLLYPPFYGGVFSYYYQAPVPAVGLDDLGQLSSITREHGGSTLWFLIMYKGDYDPRGRLREYLDATLVRKEVVVLGGQMELRRYLIPMKPRPFGIGGNFTKLDASERERVARSRARAR